MAKTIKFNLLLDGKPVRDIEGLQENFCIDDILEFYQNGLLQKWLKVRGYEDFLKKVEAISKSQSVIIELIKIFGIEKSDKEIKEATYSLEFWSERKIQLEQWNKKNEQIKNTIKGYHNNYNVLKDRIIEKKEDMAFMKAAATEICDKYYEIFYIDYELFFFDLIERSPLFIYALLMNNKLRNLLLDDQDILMELRKNFTLSNNNFLKNKIYSHFESYKKTDATDYNEKAIIEDINNKIGLKFWNKGTEGCWKHFAQGKNKKYMVLCIPNATFVCNGNNIVEEFTFQEVNGKFLILEDLAYKSVLSDQPLIYMEI